VLKNAVAIFVVVLFSLHLPIWLHLPWFCESLHDQAEPGNYHTLSNTGTSDSNTAWSIKEERDTHTST